MEKNLLKLMFLGFFVIVFVTSSIAAPPGNFDRPPPREKMEKVRKRIETLRMWKLTKALDLDEKIAARLFPLLNRYDKKRVVKERNLREDIIALKDALKNNKEGQIKDTLENLEKNHKSLQEIKDEERAELKKILTIEQQAKFILFQLEFNKEIKKIISKTKERRLERFSNDKSSDSSFPERPLFP